jgi:hypothetical protein
MKEWIVICASVVNTFTVVVLAIITRQYARSAQRQAVAAESLVGVAQAQQKAAEFQAKAAQEQSHASSAQAAAAQKSIHFAWQQSQQELGVARSVIAAAMQRAMKEIEYWQNLDSLEVLTCLPPIQLVPVNQTEILEYARKVSAAGAAHLSGVFDNLLYAEREITILQRSKIRDAKFLNRHSETENEFLKFAFLDLQAAQLDFQTAPPVAA